MSMKRTKQAGGKGKDAPETDFWAKAPVAEKTFEELCEGTADDAFEPYQMTRHYAPNACILHSKFGKGVVVGVEGAKIEVFFADGKKKLGHAAA
jgi:hypothetical protein